MKSSRPLPTGSGGGRRAPSAVREAAAIILAGIMIALTANAVSPRRIPLVGDFSQGAAGANPTGRELDVEALAAAIAAADSLEIVVLDARLPEDYAAGHIPGAFNLPAETFDDAYPPLADTLAAASSIIVYCDGGDCELSHDLATLLGEQGHKAVQLFPAGIAGWTEAGKATAEGSEP